MKPSTSYTAKDLASDQEVKWCPGCGDYSILKQVQTVIPELGIPLENLVFISGIGCSSRFPYYMNTYGMHSIHGRAPAIASGLKMTRPELSIWVITGDGDGLSIGGNHLIHTLRRNVDLNILLFNNEIYGLTKGQYSPTSPAGQQTKSTPLGSIDHPFNPLALALGADATFVARTVDRDPQHMRDILRKADEHKGSSFIEIYQNCNVFNDGTFARFTDKGSKAAHVIHVEAGKPLLYDHDEKGIRLDGLQPEIVHMAEGYTAADLMVHDPQDPIKAQILSRFFDEDWPRPFGLLYEAQRPTYEDLLQAQMAEAQKRSPKPDLNQLIRGKNAWHVS